MNKADYTLKLIEMLAQLMLDDSISAEARKEKLQFIIETSRNLR